MQRGYVLAFEDNDDEDEFDETKRQVSRLYGLLSNGQMVKFS